jgi:hypothetical protein
MEKLNYKLWHWNSIKRKKIKPLLAGSAIQKWALVIVFLSGIDSVTA